MRSSNTLSGMPPARVATTGTRLAAASRSVEPNPSLAEVRSRVVELPLGPVPAAVARDPHPVAGRIRRRDAGPEERPR